MRPPSHREQIPERRCGNCLHAHFPEYKDHLLCFHGDNITASPSFCRPEWSDVLLNDEPAWMMDGDDYDMVWGGRVVGETDICDEWEAKTGGGE